MGAPSFKHLVPAPGPSFRAGSAHARPCGRIAGSSAPLEPAIRQRALASLGERARVLDGPGLVADFDACSLDGQPIADDAAWLRVIAAGRLADVEGAFVLAWWDRDGALRLARDQVGHRTLYYALRAGALVFASRLATLLDAFAVPRRIDLRSVAAFLAYAYVPGRATMVEDARELLPGEVVRMHAGGLVREDFWALPAERAAAEPADEATLRDGLRAGLERVVGGLLPAGEPVCASLSGGIDSSLVVALARRLHGDAVRTFSIHFGADYRSELQYSAMVATHVGSEHHVVELRPATVVAHLDDTIARMDKPNGDPLTVPNALLFREMRAYGRVVLNGEGGDPCFGGPKNLPMLLAELYGDGSEDGVDDDAGPRARERTYLRAHLKCFDDLEAMLDRDVFARACAPPLEDDLAPWFADARWPSLVGKLMAINVRYKGGHHILPKVDALSEPFGALPRSPLFARSIVETAMRLAPVWKLHGSTEKYLLKEAVRDLLPREIVERGKSGMLVPVEAWFQGPLLPVARERLLGGLTRAGLFRREVLERLIAGKVGGLRPRRGVKIWLLVTLESHLRALGLIAG